MARPPSRSAVVALAVALAVGVGRPARGGRPLTHLNRAGEAGLIELPRATLIGKGRYAFGAWFNYYRHQGAQAVRASPVSAGLGLPLKLDLALAFVNTAREDPTSGGATVELDASLKRLLFDQRRHGVDLALLLRGERLFGPPDLSSLAVVERGFGALTLVGLAGYRFGTEDPGARSELRFGAGGELRLGERLALQAEALGLYDLASDQARLGVSGGARLHLFGPLMLTVGLAGLVERTDLRLVVGLGYRPTPLPDEDSDEDGVPDVRDLCPEEPEDADRFQDTDGCPDPDNDGDGIPDEIDPTPDGAAPVGLHKGPVRMKMRIRPSPIPVWIMQQREDRELFLGVTVGLRLPIRLPAWVEDRRR